MLKRTSMKDVFGNVRFEDDVWYWARQEERGHSTKNKEDPIE